MPVRTASLKSTPALVCAAVLLSTAVVAFAAGPKAYVGNFKDSTVSIIDTANDAVIGTVPVSAGPHGMTMTPDGKTVYVSGDESSTVSVIDTATDRVTYAVDVGKTPHGLAMQPDGRMLLVAVYGEDRVAFVDTATRAIMASVDVTKPHTIAIRPDGKLAYVASQQPGNFALVVVDLARRTVVRSIALDKPPRDLEFSYDGKALYFTLAGVSAVQVLDPQTDRIVAAVATGASPHIASYFRGAPAATAVVQGPGELLLFDPATNAPLRTIAVGKQPHWVAASADGKRAYVTNEGSNDLSVVDLASGQVTTIAVGNAPRKVVVQQTAMKAGGAATVSIANFAFVPGELTIAAGDTVTWSNDDGAPHGLAYKDGAPGTNLLLPGAKFARTFDRPGSYDYVCSVHPYMSGKVFVRSP
ncbi:MAG TPA: plastocyanin/azurin family copper-binding protein [Casimicrobiaceae bacterium]|nr:plastocyanin/azurin family copper-binding protein [Casimicrobiaceae bacterium]